MICCPYLLRYLVAALLISKPIKRTGDFTLHKIAEMLGEEICSYSDSLTRFLVYTLEEFDLDSAKTEIMNLKAEFSSDYFLHSFSDKIVQNARVLLFDTYCKIHNELNLEYGAYSNQAQVS